MSDQKTMQDLLNTLIETAQQRPLTSDELAEMNNAQQGFGATIGLRYTRVTRGEVRAMVRVSPSLFQPWGLVNGGVYCAIAESIGSIAGVIVAGAPVVGVNNNTDFIRPVSAGIIEAVATPLQTGRRTQLWVVEMSHNGETVARTSLRTMVMSET
ncbi:MAG: PaaI family thioesterase [Corynebacterium sp.]|nr:PaaI family thioesterase [Corynebacterium sp.]